MTNLNLDGETVIKKSGANLQRSIETVGGHLYLTPTRLIFKSHAFNVQRGNTEIKLADIKTVYPCWTRLLGLVPVAPNSIAVVSSNPEHEYRFVLWGRQKWVAAVQAAIGGSRSS